jgi:hypothetical protein
VERRRYHLCLPKSVPFHTSNRIVTTKLSIFSSMHCGKPSCHQRKNKPLPLETIDEPRLQKTGFHQQAQHTVFADVTIIMSIQEQYLNASTLKDVNIPMSDANKRQVAKYWMTSPLSCHSFWTLDGILQLLNNASPHAMDQPPTCSKNYYTYNLTGSGRSQSPP